jgi:hypothetical protein
MRVQVHLSSPDSTCVFVESVLVSSIFNSIEW